MSCHPYLLGRCEEVALRTSGYAKTSVGAHNRESDSVSALQHPEQSYICPHHVPTEANLEDRFAWLPAVCQMRARSGAVFEPRILRTHATIRNYTVQPYALALDCPGVREPSHPTLSAWLNQYPLRNGGKRWSQ